MPLLRRLRLNFAATDVIVEPTVGGSCNARRLTRSTTHQCSQKVAVAFIVAGRLFFVQSQFHLHAIEIFLTHQGWHRSDRNPRVGWREFLPVCRVAQRMSGRPANTGRTGSTSTNIQLACVYRVDEQAAKRSRTPMLISTRGWKTELQ